MKTIHKLCGESVAMGCIAIALIGTGCSSVAEEDDETQGMSSQELGSSPYDAVRGNRLADRANAMWNGRGSQGLCLKGVGDSLDSAGVSSPAFPRLPGAVDFDNWARANPGELARRGFEQQALDINRIPRGSIITWRPGQCGYHGTYGHIEIVSDHNSSRACSDFCGPIRKNCGAPGIFVPVHGGGGGGGVGVGGGGPMGSGPCGVEADKKLHCGNRVSAMREKPWASSPVVNTLRSTHSWFACWWPGEPHAGGNNTWYWTQGDDNGNWGFVPAMDVNTPGDFDTNASARGLVKCGD